MFTGISWSDYFVVVAILSIIYYLFVGVVFYAADVKNLLTGKSNIKFPGTKKGILPELQVRQNPLIEASDDTFQEVENLIQSLKEGIADASGKKYIRQEFFLYLQLILEEYPNIKNSPFRSAIGEFIISECEKQGAITLSEEEIGWLWKDT